MQLRRGRLPPDVPRLGAGGGVCVCVAGRGLHLKKTCVEVLQKSRKMRMSPAHRAAAQLLAITQALGAVHNAMAWGLLPAASAPAAAPARSSFAPRCLRRACVFWAGRTGSRRRAAPATATWPCRMRACTRWPVPSTRAHVRRRRASMHTAASLAYPRTTRAPQPALSHCHAHPRRGRIALGF